MIKPLFFVDPEQNQCKTNAFSFDSKQNQCITNVFSLHPEKATAPQGDTAGQPDDTDDRGTPFVHRPPLTGRQPPMSRINE